MLWIRLGKNLEPRGTASSTFAIGSGMSDADYFALRKAFVLAYRDLAYRCIVPYDEQMLAKFWLAFQLDLNTGLLVPREQ
jgi:hypothetical protein